MVPDENEPLRCEHRQKALEINTEINVKLAFSLKSPTFVKMTVSRREGIRSVCSIFYYIYQHQTVILKQQSVVTKERFRCRNIQCLFRCNVE